VTTPTTPEGLARYDDLPPLDAIVAAWTEPGSHPEWHRRQKAEVWRRMPLLARALDRAAAEATMRRERPAPGRDAGGN